MNYFRRKNKKSNDSPQPAWMQGGVSPENSLERGMEQVFHKKMEQTTVSERMKRIEVAVERLGKHYEEYEDIVKFVRYLGATERFFLQTEQEGELLEETKQSIIESDMRSVSESLGLQADFFETIQREFKLYQSDTSTLYKIADELSQKHADCEECVKFIYYVRDMYAMLLDTAEREQEPVFLKEKVIKAHMEIICSDGSPELSELQNVYREFCERLGS